MIDRVLGSRKTIYWVFVIGVLAKIVGYTTVPGGSNNDEVFAGFEAYSLLKFGVDSWGYHFPVYLTAWGSGMNALASYLMIPFIAVFGLEIWVIRIPQLIIGCISIVVFYKLVRLLFNQKAAIISGFIFAIMPWHIMMCRWGLESNLAPGFVLLGLYFLVKAYGDSDDVQHNNDKNNIKNKWLILSAVFYGLSLYTYATVWIILPITLAGMLIGLLITKKFRLNRYVILFVIIMFLFALPLLLFLMVNKGIIPEISTAFISIPKLTYFRSGEISLEFARIKENFINLLKILIFQVDGQPFTSTKYFGLYYMFSLPLGIIGIGYVVLKAKVWAKIVIFVNLLACVFYGSITYVNIVRINLIHVWVILFVGIGTYVLVTNINKAIAAIGILVVTSFLLSFIFFEIYYFTEHRALIDWAFQDGLEEAVEYALDIKGDEILYVDRGILFPQILFYTKQDPIIYRDTVEYEGQSLDAPFLYATSYDGVKFVGINEEVYGQHAGIYIVHDDLISEELEELYEIHRLGRFSVIKVDN